MKIRQRSVCDNCRKRKLGCDGIRPECTQCRLSRQTCTGYPDAWTFVPPNTPTVVQSQSKFADFRDTVPESDTWLSGARYIESNQQGHRVPASNPGSGEPGGMDISDYVSRIIQCYMPEEEQYRACNGLDDSQPRICGSWVEVMYGISEGRNPDAVMGTAVRAFALSVMQNSADAFTTQSDALHAYYHAIQTLRRNLDLPAGRFHTGLAVAIMCLGLTELMFPKPPSGLTPHINGVGGLFQLEGPRFFQSGTPHKLFAGFLPLLTIDAFRLREPTFLAATEWQHEPFALSPPSSMQKLLGESAIIPSLLHRVDHQYKASSERNISLAEQLICSFVDALGRLQRLENALVNQGHRPFPQQPPPCCQAEGLDFPERILWFHDITTANVFIHIWTFKVVCMTELRDLAISVPSRIFERQDLSGGLHQAQLDHQARELSVLTCQSMEFCLQDSMALYGPASTLYPLQVAYQNLRVSPRHRKSVDYIEWTVERLVAKGLHAVPYIVFDA